MPVHLINGNPHKLGNPPDEGRAHLSSLPVRLLFFYSFRHPLE